MQHAGAVFDVLLDARVVIVKVIRGERIAGTGQADDGPLAADGADLGFDAHALGVCQSDQLLGLLHVLLNGVVAAVEHDGREACFNTLIAAFERAMVQMQSNGNINVQIL